MLLVVTHCGDSPKSLLTAITLCEVADSLQENWATEIPLWKISGFPTSWNYEEAQDNIETEMVMTAWDGILNCLKLKSSFGNRQSRVLVKNVLGTEKTNVIQRTN